MQQQIEWVYVWIGLAIVVIGLVGTVVLFTCFGMSSKRIAKRTLWSARKLATCRWYVKEKVHLQGGIGLELFPEGKQRRKFFIPFRVGHPDIDLINQLEHMDIVEFEIQENSMECALMSEICGFLRVKKVGHFA